MNIENMLARAAEYNTRCDELTHSIYLLSGEMEAEILKRAAGIALTAPFSVLQVLEHMKSELLKNNPNYN
jgi:hypothetical protein